MKNGCSKTHFRSPTSARRYGEVFGPVVEPGDPVGFPLDGVGVEVIGDVVLLAVPFAEAQGAGIAGPVQCAHDQVRLSADILHDVHFTAIGPVFPIEVRAEHPERRPQASAGGHLEARFDPAILEFLQPLGLQPGRGVVRAFVLLLPGFDDQQTVLDAGVFGPVGVELRLAVAPTPGAEVVGPVGFVNRLAVEFIMPDQLHARRRGDRRRGRTGCQQQYHQQQKGLP